MPALDRQPQLADDLVALRPWRAGDWDALYAVARDPLVWRGHPAHDRWQEAVFRQFFDDGLASGGALIIADRGNGEVIGASRYDFERAGPGEVEIGWTFLARAHWGGPVNAAVKRLMSGHALGAVERVIFLVGDTNLRSRRAMEKIGAVLTDREHIAEMAGRQIRHLIYAIDRDCFAGGPLAGAP